MSISDFLQISRLLLSIHLNAVSIAIAVENLHRFTCH
ncbi:hypothetical protein Cyagr_1923 [Cyanobium gracile PCC 6307]|uniref:Uncharacterized protein n=1 Tax=Cyanobium gracile (strain ATCC 27147 / PCC 6307) TaxID=292564 RepID=K9P7W2_CYAGP|nr:hypothetical protein Cyagr_1923 [Cyanobium gracile PCC 6307]